MGPSDETIEDLIVRKLDGALSEDEALELDRLLIRSPEARHLYEEYQRQDAAAAKALAELFPPDEVTPVAVSSADRREARPRRRVWVGLSMVAALAACIAVAALFRTSSPSGTEVARSGGEARNVLTKVPVEPAQLDDIQRPLTRVQPAAHEIAGLIDRRVGSDWYGVRGSDGNIYWLQVNRTHTLRRPGAGSKIKLANGGL